MITCRLCKRKFRSVNWLHLRTHNISFAEYQALFPNEPVHCEETRSRIARGLVGNTYTLGHKLSEEHRQKIGEASKAMWQRPSFRKVMSQKHEGGNVSQALSMRRLEVREKCSLARKKYFENPENREKHREKQLQIMGTPEMRRRNSLSHMGIVPSEEARRKTSLAMKGRIFSKAHRERLKLASLVVWQNPEEREKLIRGMVRRWQDGENAKQRVASVMRANHARPNKAEQQLLLLLGKNWRYTGDGSLIVAGKCPDFWNGDHRLVELFGDYWHQGENPQERIDLFKQCGFDCIVIWEHELWEENVSVSIQAKLGR